MRQCHNIKSEVKYMVVIFSPFSSSSSSSNSQPTSYIETSTRYQNNIISVKNKNSDMTQDFEPCTQSLENEPCNTSSPSLISLTVYLQPCKCREISQSSS